MSVYKLNEDYDSDFALAKSDREIDDIYGRKLNEILKDWDKDGDPDNWGFLGIVGEFPYYLKKVANELIKLGDAYFKRMDEVDENSWVFENTPIDNIIDTYTGKDFVEVTGRAGGDILVFRRYNDGRIVER